MTRLRISAIVFAIAAALGYSGGAWAQATSATATANANATVIAPLTISEQTELDFGSFSAPSVGEGAATVTVDAGTGAASSTGGIVHNGGEARGEFDVTGEGTNTYTITLPADDSVQLIGPGGVGVDELNVAEFVDSEGGSGALTGGLDKFFVGGTIDVPEAATPGAYSATYDVTVAYP